MWIKKCIGRENKNGDDHSLQDWPVIAQRALTGYFSVVLCLCYVIDHIIAFLLCLSWSMAMLYTLFVLWVVLPFTLINGLIWVVATLFAKTIGAAVAILGLVLGLGGVLRLPVSLFRNRGWGLDWATRLGDLVLKRIGIPPSDSPTHE
ncbi:hypothetical protein JAAARDRAFT_74131 [Jaapia argillacea MUCL 33604]|uniref:Uncharacterized protein n=1 Tax=Jaapia argillacea MUCL 33604 TaxID=933084 RepID=A0A067P9X3_9AGAM|nr:hypothetical protein JAAARDRAFT_74131 [Jaapia argillacea MUCL 33604]